MPVQSQTSEQERFQRQFLSELLAARSADVADLAARSLLERAPALADFYRPVARLKWRDHLAGRVSDLAAAAWAGRADVFVEQVRWAATAFRSRGVPLEHLRLSLSSLHSVLQSEVPAEDRGLVDCYMCAAMKALESPDDTPPATLTVTTPQGGLAARYLLAILEGDRTAAADIVLTAVNAGLAARDAYLHVLVPVQEELGRMWHVTEITVAEEHFATATTQFVMSQLLPLAQRNRRDGRVVLAGSVEGNTHDIGVQMVADFLEMDGWRPICLGANIPHEDLAVAAADFGVHLVALSAAMPSHLRSVEEAIGAIRGRVPRPVKVLVGGRAFRGCADVWAEMGADAYAPDVEAAVRTAGELVPRVP